ncbi:MAG: exodeoxyribonuclease I [Proteobacteria bacterium]|nr:exodeoxyribonuclease I [Pseudomonadota bacterium]
MKTFLFYDLETTGLNKSFDQILQFAAIRTDVNFREIERNEIKIKLRPDVVPSPYAMITHRLSIKDLMTGEFELDAILKIHRIINEKDTISLGYNTLNFDDEFLRFSFYRNLLSPYTHQYANGCSRMDIFPMTIMYYLYKNDVISWPVIEGKPSLKLENISLENKLAEGQAHDAMVDVEATVALAKIFKQEDKMWQYLIDFFDKKTDQDRVKKLPQSFQSDLGIHTMGLIHNSALGNENNYMAPVIYIGDSKPYSNQSLWLRMDLPELQTVTIETIKEGTWVLRKRFGEPGILLPPEDRFWKLIGEKRNHEVEENIKWVKEHPSIFREIVMYHREFRYPMVPDIDPDAALYQNGFLSKDDQAVCREFHLTPFPEKQHIIARLKDRTTRKLAERILYRNSEDNLKPSPGSEYISYLGKINSAPEKATLVDYRGEKKLTPAEAISDIKKIRGEQKMDHEQADLLEALEAYINQKFIIP